MSTHNIGFYEDLTTIIFQLSSNMHLISSSVSKTHIVTLAQKVNNSILHTFQEKQKMFYLFLFSNHATVISCFQMSFLTVFKCGKSSSYSFIIM